MSGFNTHGTSRWPLVVVVALIVAAILPGCGGEPGRRAYDEGVDELLRGEYARARVLLEKSINQRPASAENAMAYNYLGVVSTRLGQLDRAMEEFRESRRLDETSFEATYNLALLMYEGGNTEQATDLFREASLTRPDDTRALRYLAFVHMARDEHDVAERVLRQALERAPGTPVLLTSYALAARATQGSADYVSHIMRALEQAPDYPPALFNLGLAYERDLDDPDRAITFYGRYLEVMTEGPHRAYAEQAYRNLLLTTRTGEAVAEDDALVVPKEDEAPAPMVSDTVRTFDELLQDAKKAAADGDHEASLNLLLEAAERGEQQRHPESTRIALQRAMDEYPERGEPFYAWGQFCIDRADYDEAMTAFRQALNVKPRWPDAMLGLGEAATEAREYDLALVTLKQLVRFAPDHAGACWALASLYDQHLGNVQKAIAAYQGFIQAFPGDAHILRAQERLTFLEKRLAHEKAEQQKKEAAVAETPKPKPAPEPEPKVEATPAPDTRAASRNMSAAVSAYNRGTQYQERGDYSNAIYYYLRAVENNRSFANAYYNLGTVYKATGETRRAKDAYLRAVQLQPKMVNARYNLALVYLDLNEYSAAIEQLRATLKQNEKHAPAHYVLGRLYARNRQAAALARRHYKRFLELSPRDPSANNVRAWLRDHPDRTEAR